MSKGYHEEADPRTDKAPRHQAAANKSTQIDISNASIVPRIELSPDNFDDETLKSIWNPILDKHGWWITDVDSKYGENEVAVTIESEDASTLMTTEDMLINVEILKELYKTHAFKDILVNINDSSFIKMECELYPDPYED